MGDPWAISLFIYFLLCHSFFPFLFPALSTLPRSLALCQFICCLFLPLLYPLVRFSLLLSLLFPPLPPSLLYLSHSFSSPTALLLPSPHSHRGLIYLHCWVKRGVFCLPPAVVTWHHAGGDSKSDEPTVSAPLPHRGVHVCLELTVCGRERKSLCACLSMNKFLRVCFLVLFLLVFNFSYISIINGNPCAPSVSVSLTQTYR